MPIYSWRLINPEDGAEHCIEVIRTFDKYEDPPTEEELARASIPAGCTGERIIGLSHTKFSAGWGSGPGNRAKGGGH
jgi:hypothetical protein